MTPPFEIGTQDVVVVDLSVERDRNGSILAEHRLAAVVAEIDDRESPVAEPDSLPASRTHRPSPSGPRCVIVSRRPASWSAETGPRSRR